MNRNPRPHRRVAALLLAAAAALPITALSAQEAQTPTEPAAQTPPAETPQPSPPPPAPAPAEPVATEPAPTTAPAPVTTAPAATEPRATRRTTTTRTVTRTAPARVVRIPAGPAPVVVAPLAPAAPALEAPAATLPAEALPTEVLPETPATPTPAPAPAVTRQESGGSSMLPWLLGGLLLLGALAFFALRSRRRGTTDVYEEAYEHREAHEPVVETHLDETPVAAAARVAAAAAATHGHPDIELRMRPVRAGVDSTDARVEFELTVDNKGDAPAQDLRVSTWMLAAGSSEAEQALIEPRGSADTPPVTIDAGEARTMEASVALPTSQVQGDSVLPVVVADARYTLPDGREEHRSVSFAVGVPVEGELAHFDTENPSGLHEGVEARPFGRGRD